MYALISAVPIALAVISFVVFFAAFRMRDGNALGRFELFYGVGNLFMLAALYTLYLSLQQNGDAFANVVFPFFQAMMWIYFLICLILVFRLIRNIMSAMWRRQLRDYLGW